MTLRAGSHRIRQIITPVTLIVCRQGRRGRMEIEFTCAISAYHH